MNKFIYLSFITFALFSCNSNEDKKILEKLTSENDSLKTELKKMQMLPEDCKVMSYPTFFNYNVNQGDSAILSVGLLKTDTKSPVVVLWNEETKKYSDTIKNNNGIVSTVSIYAKTKGDNVVQGKVIYFCNDREVSLPFEASYLVK
ncbi:hypothetical protein [Fluviicola taffensis]|nr:hypothetical protein [Fluviicola taffensis]